MNKRLIHCGIATLCAVLVLLGFLFHAQILSKTRQLFAQENTATDTVDATPYAGDFRTSL